MFDMMPFNCPVLCLCLKKTPWFPVFGDQEVAFLAVLGADEKEFIKPDSLIISAFYHAFQLNSNVVFEAFGRIGAPGP